MDAGSQDPLVWIVCSVHEPGTFLDEQIESLRAQTHEHWKLLVRIDGRDAAAMERLDGYRASDPRIIVDHHSDERLGAAASFGRLLEGVLERGAEWVALADQDDIWHPDKLERAMTLAARIRSDDPTRPAAGPLLIHSDLEVIDEGGGRVHESLFSYQRIHHEGDNPLRVLVVQNFVTGCATLVNRALLEVALPIPPEAIMHDWWLALCASAFGRIELIDGVTTRYRQHAANQIGAQSYDDVVRDLRVRAIRLHGGSPDPFIETLRQARALRVRLGEHARAPDPHGGPRTFLDRYLALFAPGVSRWHRVRGLRALGAGRQARLLDLTLKARLLMTPIALEEP